MANGIVAGLESRRVEGVRTVVLRAAAGLRALLPPAMTLTNFPVAGATRWATTPARTTAPRRPHLPVSGHRQSVRRALRREWRRCGPAPACRPRRAGRDIAVTIGTPEGDRGLMLTEIAVAEGAFSSWEGARAARGAPGARIGGSYRCEYPRCAVVVVPPGGRPAGERAGGGHVRAADRRQHGGGQAGREQDHEAVRAMHAAMSPENMYLRFFSMSPAAAEREARRVCREPDSDHAALLAWQDGRLVGVAAYELAGKPGIAEVAFAVPDDMHGRGVASLLLEHLVWLARQRGLQAFTAETLAENSAMLRVFADAGLPAQAADIRWRGRADLPAARPRRRLPAGQLPGDGGQPGKPGGRGEPAPAAAAAVGRRGGREPPAAAQSAGPSCATS